MILEVGCGTGRWLESLHATGLGDPFLIKESGSTLALLSDEAYVGGLQRIHQVLQSTSGAVEAPVFRSEFNFCMISGRSRSE